jgi:hypothetical protein
MIRGPGNPRRVVRALESLKKALGVGVSVLECGDANWPLLQNTLELSPFLYLTSGPKSAHRVYVSPFYLVSVCAGLLSNCRQKSTDARDMVKQLCFRLFKQPFSPPAWPTIDLVRSADLI